MDNRVAGCQPPAGATPLLRFGLPSPPGVVGMVMAPGSASGKHPFYVVCKWSLGCCMCGGRRVGVGVCPPPPPDNAINEAMEHLGLVDLTAAMEVCPSTSASEATSKNQRSEMQLIAVIRLEITTTGQLT